MKKPVFLVVAFYLFLSCNKKENTPESYKAILFTKTTGFRHGSIEQGKAMFNSHAKRWQLELVHTESAAVLKERLPGCRLLILLNTTGQLFTAEERQSVQSFVQDGGAILAIHAAADAEYGWSWYGQMLGARFRDHPEIQEAVCAVRDSAHPAAAGLPPAWTRTDEWYNFQSLQQDNHIILTVDEQTYQGGAHGALHPLSWCREFEGGKIFYTGMGHTPDTYAEPLFIRHIEGAIAWLLQ